MKIEAKLLKADRKASCCNNYASILYRFKYGDNNGWFCADCFMKMLLDEKYFIEENDYKKAYNLFMDYWDYLPDEDKPEIDKKLKKLGL